MEEVKKRKLDNGENGEPSSGVSQEHLRSLVEPLTKSQLVHLLAQLGSKYSPVAGEIMNLVSADPAHRKLFVRGLGWNTTSETLRAAFEAHGEIEEGAVIFDKTGKSRGFGFITYKNMESAQDALKASNKWIDGRLAACNLACYGWSSASVTPDQSQRKLYIGGLSPEITSETLLNFFGSHGEIEEGSVAYDKDTQKSRGFGFITYKTAEAAKKALDDSERTLGGRKITVKYADIKSKSTPTQLPQTGAPVMMSQPMTSGYPQLGQAPGPPAPLSYGYPQPLSSYPAPTYPIPPVPSATPAPPPASAPAPVTAPMQYPPHAQIPYVPPSTLPRIDPFSMPPPPTPVCMPGYTYYAQ